MGVLSLTTFCWEHACAFTLSVFLPGAHVYVVLPDTRRPVCTYDIIRNIVCIIILSIFRARRALSIFKDVPLRTSRALSFYKLYMGIYSALLVLNEKSLNLVI